MVREDVVAGGAFLLVGAGLIASGTGFPDGVAGLPGAGFFPQAIGTMMAALAISLGVRSLRRAPVGPKSAADMGAVAVVAALLLVYLALWGSGFFFARTAVFVLVTLRFFGQRWLPATAFSVVLAAFVYLAFDVGLNVNLR